VNRIDYIAYGVKAKFEGWEICRMFSPYAFHGNVGRRDLRYADGNFNEEYVLLKKFLKKYPEINWMPQQGPL